MEQKEKDKVLKRLNRLGQIKSEMYLIIHQIEQMMKETHWIIEQIEKIIKNGVKQIYKEGEGE